MDYYNKYLKEAMKRNHRNRQYEDLLTIRNLCLPEDILNHIRLQYKYDTIEKECKNHYKYEVMRELKFKAYYSRRMYNIYLEVYSGSGSKGSYLESFWRSSSTSVSK